MRDGIYDVLSLGAGVQSSVLLLMSCEGLLPRFDYAVFADTQWEPSMVYTHLEWLESQAASCGIPVLRVTNGSVKENCGRMPFYLSRDGKRGILSRGCTEKYKIRPQHTWLKRDVLGLKKGCRLSSDVKVRQWFGITTDEVHRMKQSPDAWRAHVYPFCGIGFDMGRVLNRRACQLWFAERFPGRELPRSACIGCPYRRDHEWQYLKENDPEAFKAAVEFDASLRGSDRPASIKSCRNPLYVHDSLRPLGEIDFRDDRNQPSLFGNECEGMCGL